MKKFALALSAVLAALPCFAAGSRDAPASGGAASRASGSLPAEPRVFAAFVVEDPEGEGSKASAKLYAEGMHVPQALAAYAPTAFAVAAKERRLSFSAELPYRVLSRADLGDGVFSYSLETSAVPRGPRPAGAKLYKISFPRKALGGSASAVQPAPYALERAARMTGLSSGWARLESLTYDSESGMFRASVAAGPQSTIK